MEKTFKEFIDSLAYMEATPNVYNQYDYSHAENEVRRQNLLIYLKKMQKLKPKIMLVGEAPGYRGCRITGVPFTSEHLLMNNMEGLDLFGSDAGFRLPVNKPKLMKEATATIIWETVIDQDLLILSWNSFPLHPHKLGKPETNRAPLKKELLLGQRPLLRLIEIFNIKHVAAVGRKAEESLRSLNVPAKYIRHPAQGGKNEFVEGLKNIISGYRV